MPRKISFIGMIMSGAAFVALVIFAILLSYKAILLRSNVSKSLYESEIMSDINQKRIEKGLLPLNMSPELSVAAKKKAIDMATRSYFSHTGPDGSTPWEYIEGEGYDFAYAGENLGVDFYDVLELDNAWMNSPGHRANILNEEFTETGIGVASGSFEGREVMFFVQMFGTPNSERNWAAQREGKVLGASTMSAASAEYSNSYQKFGIEKFLANPERFLKYSYLSLSFIILTAAFLFVLSDYRNRNMLNSTIYALGTMAFIWGLFFIYSSITFAA